MFQALSSCLHFGSADPELLSGSVFGMRSDFDGFGVVFDVYDNDNRRDNPAVFVLKNEGTETKFNHDADYAVRTFF
jgi:mannose-binding lectin 1